jgi:transposase InsO family protein
MSACDGGLLRYVKFEGALQVEGARPEGLLARCRLAGGVKGSTTPCSTRRPRRPGNRLTSLFETDGSTDRRSQVLDLIASVGTLVLVLSLFLRATEFVFYHLLLTLVDFVSALPRDMMVPEAMRLYRENIALKAQLEALERHLVRIEAPKRVSLSVRAAQVFAYLLTRGDEAFHRYFLSAPRTTILRWAARFRSTRRPPPNAGRPALDESVVEVIVTLKRENPPWGQRRIREELRRMGIRVSEPTIVRILREHGFSPRPGRKVCFDRVRAAAKDALWALDFFWVKTAKSAWLQALLVIDIHTRELLDIRVHDGWNVDSVWTTRALNGVFGRTKRKPIGVVHDHGPQFFGHFQRQLHVLEIEQEVTPVRIPQMNCYAERAIGSIRRELLRHVRPHGAVDLQFYLNEYRRYANTERPHQGLEGRTPAEVSAAVPEAEVIDLVALRSRRLVRRAYAHGLLQGYALIEGEEERPAA